jgi:hypothetical protein
MYPKIYNPSRQHHPVPRGRNSLEDVFSCKYCQAHVYTQPLLSGVHNRNHCPYCLWSRHVDLNKPGDRLSACKTIMQPIGLTMKPGRDKFGRACMGELMLIHRCIGCGKLSINRIAADDITERLLGVFHVSLATDAHTRNQLKTNGIRLIQEDEAWMVTSQLEGIRLN